MEWGVVVVEEGEESGPVCGDAHLGGGSEMLDDGKKPRAPRDPPPLYFRYGTIPEDTVTSRDKEK